MLPLRASKPTRGKCVYLRGILFIVWKRHEWLISFCWHGKLSSGLPWQGQDWVFIFKYGMYTPDNLFLSDPPPTMTPPVLPPGTTHTHVHLPYPGGAVFGSWPLTYFQTRTHKNNIYDTVSNVSSNGHHKRTVNSETLLSSLFLSVLKWF